MPAVPFTQIAQVLSTRPRSGPYVATSSPVSCTSVLPAEPKGALRATGSFPCAREKQHRYSARRRCAPPRGRSMEPVIGWRLPVVVVCEDGSMGRLLSSAMPNRSGTPPAVGRAGRTPRFRSSGWSRPRRRASPSRPSGLQPREIACSDLARARLTAELIAEQLGYERPVTLEPAFREHDVGEWNGLTMAEITARWPSEVELWRHRRLVAVPWRGGAGHLRRARPGSDVNASRHLHLARTSWWWRTPGWSVRWRSGSTSGARTGPTPTSRVGGSKARVPQQRWSLQRSRPVDLVSLGNEAVPGPV